MKKIPMVMLMLAGLSSYAVADWELVNDESSLHYVSIKNTHVADVNSFETLSGSITDEGKVALAINLASVATGVPVRDERMQKVLFDVAQFAEAKVTGQVDLTAVSELEVGATYTDLVSLKLSLHGVEKEIMSGVKVTRLTNDRVLVASLEPVVLDAKDFKLVEGIEQLREMANLPNISLAVPVTFSLVFKG